MRHSEWPFSLIVRGAKDEKCWKKRIANCLRADCDAELQASGRTLRKSKVIRNPKLDNSGKRATYVIKERNLASGF